MKWLCILVFVFLVSAAQAAEDRALFSDPTLEAKLESLFTPGRDLAEIKFTVDQMADPDADIAAASAELDHLADELRKLVAGGRTSAEKLAALKRLIYEAGPWNDNRPFAYDMSDPLGQKPANRYLHNYLALRRGNCITMPILFVILGQRIGLNLTLAEAPLHLLVKFTDDDGAVWNLEPTSGGGFSRDAWYRKDLPMTDKAVAEGTYLRALSSEEAVALIVLQTAETHMRAGRYEQSVVAANVLLRHFPRFAHAMVVKGSSYTMIMRRDILANYAREIDMPPEVSAYADMLYFESQSAFVGAEALGWTERDGLK
jgi:regulator of sirC expression with transglutaminase-like and TPR domain